MNNETIFNKYHAYTEYASAIAKQSYDFGNELAKAGIADGVNTYEVMSIIIDNICSAFSFQHIKNGMIIRHEERGKKNDLLGSQAEG
jgi:hypothetical protein